jgi:hypothetical protein
MPNLSNSTFPIGISDLEYIENVKLFSCLSSLLRTDESVLVEGVVMMNFGWEFCIVPNTIIDLSICVSEYQRKHSTS